MYPEVSIIANSHPLVICEGTFEKFVLERLLEANELVFPSMNLYDATTTRSAKSIQKEFLNYQFDWPVCIVRLLDSRKERFRLDKLYAERFPVINIFTHPAIEMLIVIAEGKADEYGRKYKSKMNPAQYCMQILNMGDVKSRDMLERYWDTKQLIDAIIEYKRITKLQKGELCLADLLRSGRAAL